ncbi:MarR family winged helix-turn-helix transcriptional regulator [Nocardia sp. BMG51109]|uniref:MarR family winged helix-turn-helix transcriptional regulator n=1 Tax=Nocardia sp. BMG51109 TaxID=1056816 RepID=UPI000688E1DC|nr:MarR family transcriptional regulator [Nocardia sp. BMG51109]
MFEFVLLIKAVARELERRMNEAMQPLGLTAAQADALAVIGQAQPIGLRELGDLLIAEGGHPSRLVDRLVETGLVERRAPAADRRRIELSLTAEGTRLREHVLEIRRALVGGAREMLPAQDVEPGLRLLRELVRFTSFSELIDRRRGLAGDDHAVI